MWCQTFGPLPPPPHALLHRPTLLLALPRAAAGSPRPRVLCASPWPMSSGPGGLLRRGIAVRDWLCLVRLPAGVRGVEGLKKSGMGKPMPLFFRYWRSPTDPRHPSPFFAGCTRRPTRAGPCRPGVPSAGSVAPPDGPMHARTAATASMGRAGADVGSGRTLCDLSADRLCRCCHATERADCPR